MTRIVCSMLLMAACLSALPACRGTRGGGAESFRPEPIAGDQAAIYVYRGKGMGSPRVFIDQQDLGDLRRGEYLVRVVRPGEHFIRVEGASDMARSVMLLEGDAAYFEVTTSGWGKHPTLTMPDEATARARIGSASRIPTPQ